MPVYRWGNKADKPRPEPLTAKEVRARRQQPDVVKRAIRLVYQQNYSKGVTWQEALGDHKRRER
jgi:hypothetical protein